LLVANLRSIVLRCYANSLRLRLERMRLMEAAATHVARMFHSIIAPCKPVEPTNEKLSACMSREGRQPASKVAAAHLATQASGHERAPS
jgi:hypothetical protein